MVIAPAFLFAYGITRLLDGATTSTALAAGRADGCKATKPHDGQPESQEGGEEQQVPKRQAGPAKTQAA